MIALSITMAAVLAGCVGESTAPNSNAAAEPTAPEGTAPKDTASKDTAPKRTAPNGTSYVGTYTLVRVDDARLPVLYFGAGDNSTDLAITAGTFTLRADKSFADTLDISQTLPSIIVAQLIANGTYTVEGSRLTLTVPTENFRYYTSLVVATVEAENLDIYVSFKADGKLFLYRKTP